MWAYPETLEAAKRERERIAAMPDDLIAAKIKFFGHPRLAPYYTGLLYDLTREQDRRIADGIARNTDGCNKLLARLHSKENRAT